MNAILDFLTENWEMLSLLIYEIVVRVWPTKWNLSILDQTMKLIGTILKNRRIPRGDENVERKADGTLVNAVKVDLTKHIIKSLLVVMLVGVFAYSSQAQQWENFKGIRLVNNRDTTQQLAVQGSLFFDDVLDSLYLYDGTRWLNLSRAGSNGGGASVVIPSGQVPYGTGTGITSELAFKYFPSNNRLQLDNGSLRIPSVLGETSIHAPQSQGHNGGVQIVSGTKPVTRLTNFGLNLTSTNSNADSLWIRNTAIMLNQDGNGLLKTLSIQAGPSTGAHAFITLSHSQPTKSELGLKADEYWLLTEPSPSAGTGKLLTREIDGTIGVETIPSTRIPFGSVNNSIATDADFTYDATENELIVDHPDGNGAVIINNQFISGQPSVNVISNTSGLATTLYGGQLLINDQTSGLARIDLNPSTIQFTRSGGNTTPGNIVSQSDLEITPTGNLYIFNLPTTDPCASAGSGAIWNDSGTLKICP